MEIEILESAFKHGISEYAIMTCLLNFKRDIMLEEEPEKRLYIGFDHNGNALEVVGILRDDILTIRHAMKLRKSYFHLLEEANGY